MKRLTIPAIMILALPACGGERSTQSSWAEAASAACLEALNEVESLGEPDTPAEVARDLERYNAVGRKLDVKLRSLEPAPQERERAQRMIEAYAAVLPVQERMARAILRGDLETADNLTTQMQRLGSAGDRLALDLGADDCAKEAFDTEPDPDVS